MKVILSTFGPLHLMKSAEALSIYVDIKIIQGWIPSWWNKWMFIFLDRIVGYKLSKTIKKRTPEGLNAVNIGIGLPEFYLWLSKLHINIKDLNLKSAILFGKLSKKYIRDAAVFHVRSGSGLGGAIEKAKEQGMKVVVDHSIAHPLFMDIQLKNEFEKNNLPFNMGMNNRFWKSVIDDCSKADILLVNSDFVKETFINAGYSSDKIRVVYLGVRDDFSSLKKDYVIKGPIKLLFTGSFGLRKGGEYILKAMSILDDIELDYTLTVIGGISGSEDLIKAYQSKKIIFKGVVPQDELKKYLAESDIYVFPSLCEGCAQSGMEAMKAGLPVIATNESGLPIINNEDGIIIESKNEKAISDAIIRLYNNESFRKKIGVNALNKMKNFTWDSYARNVFQIYNEITNQQ